MNNKDKIIEILQKRTHDSYTGGDEKLHEIRSTHRRIILFDIATEICNLTVPITLSDDEIEDLYDKHLTTVNTGIHLEDQMLLKNFKAAIKELNK